MQQVTHLRPELLPMRLLPRGYFCSVTPP